VAWFELLSKKHISLSAKFSQILSKPAAIPTRRSVSLLPYTPPVVNSKPVLRTRIFYIRIRIQHFDNISVGDPNPNPNPNPKGSECFEGSESESESDQIVRIRIRIRKDPNTILHTGRCANRKSLKKKKKMFFFQCCGSGSGIRCLLDPWIRDPE
jgi:hypothetical protein